METRVLIPNGLRLVVKDADLQSEDWMLQPVKCESNAARDDDDDNEEKPSSSSGQCDTAEELHQSYSRDRPKRNCATDKESTKAWKKQCKGHVSPSSSSSSLSSSTSSDSSSSSCSENEAEVGYFMKNSQQKAGDSRIGSSSNKNNNNPFECKNKLSSNQCEKKNDNTKQTEKQRSGGYYNNYSHVKICSTRVIEKGTVFTPNDGDVQVVYLQAIPAITKDDIRFFFGCFETITPITISSPPPFSSGSVPLISPASTTTTTTTSTFTTTSPPLADDNNFNFVRLCNWIRFLCRSSGANNINNNSASSKPNHAGSNDGKMQNMKQSINKKNSAAAVDSNWPNFTNDSTKTSPPFTTTTTPFASNKEGSEDSYNVIARFIDGRPTFKVTKQLVPGTELVARFEVDSIMSGGGGGVSAALLPATPFSRITPSTTPFPLRCSNNTSSSSPPAPYSSSSSTFISSSVPGESTSPVVVNIKKTQSVEGSSDGDDVPKERDERDLLLQQYHHHHHHRESPAFPYSFHKHSSLTIGNNALLKLKDNHDDGSNAFPLWQNSFNEVRLGRQEKGDEKGRKPGSSNANEGPLDLSKVPGFSRPVQNETLKVGTPFDSPDSNDDDTVKSIPSPGTGGFSLFSIRNVLKCQTADPPSKLFQPYSMDGGNKCSERDAFMKSISPQINYNVAGSLVTPPSCSDDHLPMRSATGVRPILRTRGKERSLLPCSVCGKAFDRPSLLKRHLRTHTGEKPHICDVCSKGFSTSSSLNTHRRIHSGEKPHQCQICGKRFTASSNLYYHRMTHNKEKPHKCALCGKSFPTPGDLKSHQYVHSGSWPYTCPVCHRGFSKPTNLRNHLSLHSSVAASSAGSNKAGDKPHTCHICNKKFAQACNLRAHIKSHEESDTSSCSVCKRTFLSTSSDMLVNGRCRNCCLQTLPSNLRESTSSSPLQTPCIINTTAAATTTPVENAKEGHCSSYSIPSILSQRIASGNVNQQLLAPAASHLALPLSQFSGLSVPGLSSALSFPASTGASLYFPVNGTHSGSSTTDLFVNAAAAAGATPPATRNALFEQLVEWNYRMANEPVGISSLGFSIMQQKILLESRMLAAQLMNTHGFGGMNGERQDLLGLRSALTQDALDPVVSGETKFMQR